MTDIDRLHSQPAEPNGLRGPDLLCPDAPTWLNAELEVALSEGTMVGGLLALGHAERFDRATSPEGRRDRLRQLLAGQGMPSRNELVDWWARLDQRQRAALVAEVGERAEALDTEDPAALLRRDELESLAVALRNVGASAPCFHDLDRRLQARRFDLEHPRLLAAKKAEGAWWGAS
ncbi:MAG TPA: hypothetical protein QGF58_20070 [Myxococcota bacterium]|nr:hypothetical protein [Myxococcota bacterium]